MSDSQLVRTAKNILPHGLVMKIIRSQAVRRRRIAAVETSAMAKLPLREAYSYRSAIEFHAARGLVRSHVLAGSIPESSLEFCSASLDKFLPARAGEPVTGLHVGNFIGVSLCHVTDYARKEARTFGRCLDRPEPDPSRDRESAASCHFDFELFRTTTERNDLRRILRTEVYQQ
jgi:hypothetical protein